MDNGYKKVRYDIELQKHMIQAIKELKEENDRLKAENESVMLLMTSHEQRLSLLESKEANGRVSRQ